MNKMILSMSSDDYFEAGFSAFEVDSLRYCMMRLSNIAVLMLITVRIRYVCLMFCAETFVLCSVSNDILSV